MTESTPRTDSFGIATTKGTQYSHCTQMQPHSHSLSHVDALACTTHALSSCTHMCVCVDVRVCECVKGLLRRFPSPVRVRASKRIEYASDINTLGHEHTLAHAWYAYIHIVYIYIGCASEWGSCVGNVSRRETTLCAARFDFGATKQRRQPIAKLQPADWTNSSGPNGPNGQRLPANVNAKDTVGKKEQQQQQENQRHVPKSVEWIVVSCWKMWKIT